MKKTFLVTLSIMIINMTALHAEICKARLMYNNGAHDDVIVLSHTKGSVTYKLPGGDSSSKQLRAPKLESIYFYQPSIFKEAIDLYKGRKFDKAKSKFIECEKAFNFVASAPNNYATLAGFYKMECSRRMFDLNALTKEMSEYDKTGLTRENQLQQLEVNVFWGAVNLKDWDRVDRLAKSWAKRKVTSHQRAQIAYCHGLALEQLSKENPELFSKALNAFNRAMSADFTHSIELATAAANQALGMYFNDPEVKQAIKLWKTNGEKPNSPGYRRLLEAHALVKLYKKAGFENFRPLKSSFASFSRYTIDTAEKDKDN